MIYALDPKEALETIAARSNYRELYSAESRVLTSLHVSFTNLSFSLFLSIVPSTS